MRMSLLYGTRQLALLMPMTRVPETGTRILVPENWYQFLVSLSCALAQLAVQAVRRVLSYRISAAARPAAASAPRRGGASVGVMCYL